MHNLRSAFAHQNAGPCRCRALSCQRAPAIARPWHHDARCPPGTPSPASGPACCPCGRPCLCAPCSCFGVVRPSCGRRPCRRGARCCPWLCDAFPRCDSDDAHDAACGCGCDCGCGSCACAEDRGLRCAVVQGSGSASQRPAAPGCVGRPSCRHPWLRTGAAPATWIVSDGWRRPLSCRDPCLALS